jgi:Ni,Fe-hydrogenase I cytochrome b subunit
MYSSSKEILRFIAPLLNAEKATVLVLQKYMLWRKIMFAFLLVMYIYFQIYMYTCGEVLWNNHVVLSFLCENIFLNKVSTSKYLYIANLFWSNV